MIFVDVSFSRMRNTCYSGNGTVVFGFDCCRIMGTFDPLYTSTIVNLGFMASTWTSQKWEQRITGLASFSATKYLKICVLVRI